MFINKMFLITIKRLNCSLMYTEYTYNHRTVDSIGFTPSLFSPLNQTRVFVPCFGLFLRLEHGLGLHLN